MNNKILILIVLLVLFIMTYLYVSRDDMETINKNQKQQTENEQIEVVDKKIRQNKSYEKRDSNVKESKSLESYVIDNLISYNRICGDSDNFRVDKIIAKMEKEDLSTLQKQALKKIITKCNQWNNSVFSMEKDEISDFKTRIKESFESRQFFLSSEVDHREKLKEAREMLKSEFKDSTLNYGALDYLLKEDVLFTMKIADNLNLNRVGGASFVQKNSSNIHLLYNCRFNEDCSRNSLSMLNMCLTDENYCNISGQQLVQTWVPQGLYSDLERTVDIIQDLVVSGYFDGFE